MSAEDMSSAIEPEALIEQVSANEVVLEAADRLVSVQPSLRKEWYHQFDTQAPLEALKWYVTCNDNADLLTYAERTNGSYKGDVVEQAFIIADNAQQVLPLRDLITQASHGGIREICHIYRAPDEKFIYRITDFHSFRENGIAPTPTAHAMPAGQEIGAQYRHSNNSSIQR